MSVGLTTLPWKKANVTNTTNEPRNPDGLNGLTTRNVKWKSKKNDLLLATWNVRTLARAGALADLKEQMAKYKIKIAALQEVRWTGEGVIRSGNFSMFYSGGDNRRNGTGFLVDNTMVSAVLDFKAVSDRLCTIRIKSRFFNITIISVYAPTEESEEDVKDMFYSQLEHLASSVPGHDVLILLGDFNAKIGKEEAFRTTIGKYSLHDNCNDNGHRLVDLASGCNLVVKSTCFPRKDIHKATWQSPDGATLNQIDHVLINARHASDVVDVKTCRGADIDSDHFMLKIRYRQKISRIREKKGSPCVMFATDKLKLPDIAEKFRNEMDGTLTARIEEWKSQDIENKWVLLRDDVVKVMEEVLGLKERMRRTEWFDDECKLAIAERNSARLRMIQRRTRIIVEDFRAKRRHASKICHRKKKAFEKGKLEEMEGHYESGLIREFYQRVKEERKGFQPKAVFCRDRNGNFIGDKQAILDRWAEYFRELLTSDRISDLSDDWEGSNEEDHVEPPTMEEVQQAINELKNNRAPGEDGIVAEVLKTGGKVLQENLFSLILEVWQQEQMPSQWQVAVICPIHKKGDKSKCSNYRGISLLSVCYKVFAKILQKRLTPIAENLIGEYQCGFRKNRSTTDQIFTIRQILEKCYEFNVDVHQLYIDFKKAYDSVIRGKLRETLREFHVPSKLINLIMLTLRRTRSKVKIDGQLSAPFEINQGLRQGDVISAILFNLVLERAVRRISSNPGGTLFNRQVQTLAFADDVGLIARSKKALSEGFKELEAAAGELGLEINEEKTEYMLMTRRDVLHQGKVELGRKSFKNSKQFKYLGSTLTNNNSVTQEIETRLAAGNKSYFALLRVMKSSIISRDTKIRVYLTVIRPVVLYGSETWTMTTRDEELIRRWERKVLRRIYGPLFEEGQWRIRSNAEIYVMYNRPDIVCEIRKGRLRWLGHVERMPEERAAKKVYKGNPGGRRLRGRPRLRWQEQVEDHLRQLGIRRWRTLAQDRELWRQTVLQV